MSSVEMRYLDVEQMSVVAQGQMSEREFVTMMIDDKLVM